MAGKASNFHHSLACLALHFQHKLQGAMLNPANLSAGSPKAHMSAAPWCFEEKVLTPFCCFKRIAVIGKHRVIERIDHEGWYSDSIDIVAGTGVIVEILC